MSQAKHLKDFTTKTRDGSFYHMSEDSMNPPSAGLLYIQHKKLVITVPADGLATNSAISTTIIMLAEELIMFPSKFPQILTISKRFSQSEIKIQHGRQDFRKYQNTLCVKKSCLFSPLYPFPVGCHCRVKFYPNQIIQTDFIHIVTNWVIWLFNWFWHLCCHGKCKIW